LWLQVPIKPISSNDVEMRSPMSARVGRRPGVAGQHDRSGARNAQRYPVRRCADWTLKGLQCPMESTTTLVPSAVTNLPTWAEREMPCVERPGVRQQLAAADTASSTDSP